MNEEAIRHKLERILQEEPENYGSILDLSTKLSGFYHNNIRFTVDAKLSEFKRGALQILIAFPPLIVSLIKE